MDEDHDEVIGHLARALLTLGPDRLHVAGCHIQHAIDLIVAGEPSASKHRDPAADHAL